MPKKIEIVYPIVAMEALQGYQDVTKLTTEKLDKGAVAKAVAPELASAVADVRKWMEGQ